MLEIRLTEGEAERPAADLLAALRRQIEDAPRGVIVRLQPGAATSARRMVELLGVAHLAGARHVEFEAPFWSLLERVVGSTEERAAYLAELRAAPPADRIEITWGELSAPSEALGVRRVHGSVVGFMDPPTDLVEEEEELPEGIPQAAPIPGEDAR